MLENMMGKLLLVQKKINGEEMENFKVRYFGQYFTGDTTLLFEDKAYTLSFHKGTMVGAIEGIPLTGIDIGLYGSMENWKDFFEKRNFGYATAPAYQNPQHLTMRGNILRFRQNCNCVAHLCRVLASVV